MQHTETITESHSQSKWRGVQSSLSRCSHNATPALKALGSLQKRGTALLRARESGSLKQGCISCNMERCTHKVSALWLSKYELSKHNNSQVIMGSWKGSGEQDTLTFYKEQQATCNKKSGRSNPPKGRKHQLVIQYQRSALKTYMPVLLYRQNTLNLFI